MSPKLNGAWISYFGIRVTNFERSKDFYTKIFDLVELAGYDGEKAKYVLFKDRRSGQRLELNWYAEGTTFATPYIPGEGLDHIGVRVNSVAEALKQLAAIGIHPSTKELGPNEDTWITSTGHHIVFIKDPDGNFIELYDHPEEPTNAPIPDHY
jgi:catechol 2,3-dioxygenase-like lactoylglutathione lyase family enzyme